LLATNIVLTNSISVNRVRQANWFLDKAVKTKKGSVNIGAYHKRVKQDVSVTSTKRGCTVASAKHRNTVVYS
jgi:hypothetical protein